MNTTTSTATDGHTNRELRELAKVHLDMARQLDGYLRKFLLPRDPSTGGDPEFDEVTEDHMVDSIRSAKQTADMAWAACMRLSGMTLDGLDDLR